LWIEVHPSGDFRMGVGLEEPGVNFCRWDRVPHRKPHVDDDTGKPILRGHKHYFAEGCEPPERLKDRGEEHIPTTSLGEAVRAFCEELGIAPPEVVRHVAMGTIVEAE
jgi:hypothetical protein